MLIYRKGGLLQNVILGLIIFPAKVMIPRERIRAGAGGHVHLMLVKLYCLKTLIGC